MRKNLLFCALAAFCLNAFASQETPEAQWGNLFGGAGGDQSISVATMPGGDVVWLSTAATTTAAPEVYYADKEIFANPTGTSNLSLICTDSNGNLKWNVYSTTGDFASNQGNVAVDTNGDIIFTAKVRHATSDHQINLIDASAKEVEIGGVAENKYYRILVAKVSADGVLSWVKMFEQSTDPAPMASGKNAEFTPDAVSSTALACDGEGNIYIGGNYASAMTVDGVTLQPANVSNWTGDSQVSCGNMFIVKLDKDGKYITSVVGEGDINGASAIQNLAWDGNRLYVYGYATGEGSFKLCGTELTPSAVSSPVIGSLGSDFKPEWLKCLPCEKVDNKAALQNVSISIYNDNLWICGQYNQKIMDTADGDKYVSATQGSVREGFIIKFDKNTGAWLASADSRTDYPDITKITAYLKIFQNASDTSKAYVYGYAMDATVGIFVREYDANTLMANTDRAWSIATGGGVPTAVSMAYDNTQNAIYITGRGNKEYVLMGDPTITTPAPRGWDVLMAKYTMPEGSSNLINSLSSDVVAPVEVYDIYGRYVGRYTQNGDANTLHLTPGIYVAGNKKIIVR